MANENEMAKFPTAAQEQFFEAIHQNQQAFIDFVRGWS